MYATSSTNKEKLLNLSISIYAKLIDLLDSISLNEINLNFPERYLNKKIITKNLLLKRGTNGLVQSPYIFI